MNNFKKSHIPTQDDFYHTDQMFTTDFSNYYSAPYDMNYEIITDILPNYKGEDLNPDHIIKILTTENEKIISLLNMLEANNKNILKVKEFSGAENLLKKLVSLTESLVNAGIHHQKKEAVLFPELEKKGVIGPIYLLKIDNEEIRKYTQRLKNVLTHVNSQNYPDSLKKVNALIKLLNLKFREHIKKESYIIFPLALKIIEEQPIWNRVKNECLNL